MSERRRVRGFKRSELVLPESDTLPFKERAEEEDVEPEYGFGGTLEPSRSTVMTPRANTMRNLHAYVRDEWAPKPLRGWLALRESAGWFGLLGRTWVPYWCVFDSRYLLLFPSKPGSNETAQATGYSVTPLDPSTARSTVTVAPTGITKTEIPLPSMMIDLGHSTVEAKFEDGQLYAFIHRPNFPEYVLCGNHIKYWIHEWQKINTIWTDEDGSLLDVPTDVVDKAGNVMEPRMDSAERFFLRQQGAILLYMAGPLQFEAWHSRLGGKWFLHYCTFDAYDPSPKLCIFSDGKDPHDNAPPKILDLSQGVISEHLDERQRAKMKIELPGKQSIICDGPNIQWWLGALQWATRDKSKGKAMFRDLIKHRRFVPVEKSISILRMQRRATSTHLKRNFSIATRDSDINKAKQRTIELADKAKAGTGGVGGGSDWKAKSGSHAITGTAVNGNGSNGARLSAAEWARQAGTTPPKRRRSSAPKPVGARDSVLSKKKGEEAEPESSSNMPSSRAQIPLITLSIPTGNTEPTASSSNANNGKGNNNNNSQQNTGALSPRKSKKGGRSKSPSARTDSPLANSLPPDATTMSMGLSSATSNHEEAIDTADVPLVLSARSPSKSPRPNVLITEDDIPQTPRSPRSPRSPKSLSPMPSSPLQDS